jgi:hypothetical protein
MDYRHRENTIRCRERAWSSLGALPGNEARAVERLLDSLHELPLDRWCAAAIVSSMSARYEEAQSAVFTTISNHELALTAWLIRDMVETAAHSAERLAVRKSLRIRRAFASARVAAEWATLATAVRPWILPVYHDALLEPFERVGVRPVTMTPTAPFRRRVERFAADPPLLLPEREA